GRATVIVRDAASEAGAAAASASSGAARARPAALEGEAIPSLVKQVTQTQINAYADVSGDHNPIHVNTEAARAVGLDGTIAHGMLSMAFVGQVLTNWLAAEGKTSAWVARLRVRFQAMVRPGDTLTCRGVLGAKTDAEQRVELWIENERGERVTTGDAD